MNISFFTQSKKELVNIYIRLRDTNIYAKTSTNLKVNLNNFKKGVIKLNTTPKNANAEIKNQIKLDNKDLIELEDNLNRIKKNVLKAHNNKKDYEIINTDWLKEIINPVTKIDTPNTLIEYFDYYIDFKKTSLKASTLKKLNVFKNRVINYQNDFNTTIYIQEVNKKFSFSLQKWCDDNGYAHNTKVKTLKVILTICNFASENGKFTSTELKYIAKNLKYKNTEHITLSFNEIQQIIDTTILNEKLGLAKDWLIISCYTAQRVSDNLYLKKENIVFQNGEYLLQIIQEKTQKPISISLDDEVIKILNKRNGHFPPVFYKNKNSNEVIYNKLIKEVCRIAKIENLVKAQFKNPKTNRYEIKEVPKYKAVTSHIGRRSFATNYYNLIETSLLIGQTGHSTEIQFLQYVGKKGVQNSLQLSKKMREVKENLNRIKEQQNKSKVIEITA